MGESQVSRRAALKTAAWSVPVIAVAAVVPRMAASERTVTQANTEWDAEEGVGAVYLVFTPSMSDAAVIQSAVITGAPLNIGVTPIPINTDVGQLALAGQGAGPYPVSFTFTVTVPGYSPLEVFVP